jgi:hypothetical protein
MLIGLITHHVWDAHSSLVQSVVPKGRTAVNNGSTLPIFLHNDIHDHIRLQLHMTQLSHHLIANNMTPLRRPPFRLGRDQFPMFPPLRFLHNDIAEPNEHASDVVLIPNLPVLPDLPNLLPHGGIAVSEIGPIGF